MSGLKKPDLGVWEDMGLYWAWRSRPNGRLPHPPPTVKRLDYLQVDNMKICIGVWDDDKYTPVNRKEAERLESKEHVDGFIATLPK